MGTIEEPFGTLFSKSVVTELSQFHLQHVGFKGTWYMGFFPFNYTHYNSKVLGHLEMSLFLKEKHIFFAHYNHVKWIRNTVSSLLML